MKKYFFLLLAFLSSISVFAHPGHGSSDGFTITHYFVEPEHALLLLTGLALVVILVRKFRSMPEKK